VPLDQTLEERWMALAIKEAQAALEEGEAPVGAVIVDLESGLVLARAHHQTKALRDPTAHAVMIALSQLTAEREDDLPPEAHVGVALPNLNLAVIATQEPCVMCAGAILLHEPVGRIVFGARKPVLGACGTALDLLRLAPRTRSLTLQAGVRERECAELLKRWAGS